MFNKLKCFIFGHPMMPTGRNTIMLHEYYCPRCNRRYVTHIGPEGNYGEIFMPANDDFDRFVEQYERYKTMKQQ